MNKSETSFGSAEGKKDVIQGLLLTALMAASPAMASEPEREKEDIVAMVSNKKEPSPDRAMMDAFTKGLKGIGQAKDMAQQKKLWLKLARAQPTMVLEHMEWVDQSLLMETLGAACESLAVEQPEVFLEKAIACTDLSNFGPLMGTASENASVAKPEAAVKFKDRYVGLVPEGQKIFDRAVANVRKKTSQAVLKTSVRNR